MEYGSTAFVILGVLAWGPSSGYDVKAVVDRSVRFFWTASYGQIYPELRLLSEAGLVKGTTEPKSGRRRTVYRITPAGRRALEDWLEQEPRVFETRDEGLLKLFFADASPATAAASLDAKRRYHEEKLKQLRAIEATGRAEGAPLLVLRFGLESSEWMVDWCTREAERLRR
jgi:PadR family transcriptional regulator, regulatory protein AphA